MPCSLQYYHPPSHGIWMPFLVNATLRSFAARPSYSTTKEPHWEQALVFPAPNWLGATVEPCLPGRHGG